MLELRTLKSFVPQTIYYVSNSTGV